MQGLRQIRMGDGQFRFEGEGGQIQADGFGGIARFFDGHSQIQACFRLLRIDDERFAVTFQRFFVTFVVVQQRAQIIECFSVFRVKSDGGFVIVLGIPFPSALGVNVRAVVVRVGIIGRTANRRVVSVKGAVKVVQAFFDNAQSV